MQYSETEIQEVLNLYENLKEHFVLNMEYGQMLLTRFHNGDPLSEDEIRDLSDFVKLSEAINNLEKVLTEFRRLSGNR